MKDNQEEFIAQISKSKNPLMVLPDSSNKETTCAGLGIHNYLKTLGKDSSIVAYNGQDPQISFLSGYEDILKEIKNARKFMLSFDTSQNQIHNVHYERKDNCLNIFVTPESGAINPRDFAFAPGQFKYDLIIVLGASEFQSIGVCWEQNADLFYDLPIINIDYHISNEQFGQLNIIDVKSSGVSELVAGLIPKDEENLPSEVADCFYTGILEATESFQSSRTTPKTLTAAAKLIDQGANHKEIIRKLYKTQNIETIKLWGRLMARMKNNQHYNYAWTTVTPDDFEKSDVTTANIRSIFDKIRNSYSRSNTLLLLWETSDKTTRGIIQNSNREHLKELYKGIEWGNAVIFELNEPLETGEAKILKTLEEDLKEE